MYEWKKIRAESIPRAITKAERYRLLNEPREAESICRDVLATDPNHTDAIKILILATTDQFSKLGERKGMREKKKEVESLLARLTDDYCRHYYTGVMLERWAKGLLGAQYEAQMVLNYFEKAMQSYDSASELADGDNQDAALRWNTCARIVERNGLHKACAETTCELESFNDEVPMR